MIRYIPTLILSVMFIWLSTMTQDMDIHIPSAHINLNVAPILSDSAIW